MKFVRQVNYPWFAYQGTVSTRSTLPFGTTLQATTKPAKDTLVLTAFTPPITRSIALALNAAIGKNTQSLMPQCDSKHTQLHDSIQSHSNKITRQYSDCFPSSPPPPTHTDTAIPAELRSARMLSKVMEMSEAFW
jgi:hypothetical protein